MNLHRISSTISFVAAVLALSGNALAAPADVSGDTASPALTTNVSGQAGAGNKQPLYLSLNHFPSAMAGDALEQFDLPPAPMIYDEEFLESLQEELSIELDALIDLQAM